jgi:hypothetical protein
MIDTIDSAVNAMGTTLKFFGNAYLLIGQTSRADDFLKATPCKTVQQEFPICCLANTQ